MSTKSISVVIFILSLLTANANASVVTFICTYQKYANDTGISRAEKDFKLTFNLDTVSSKAFMVGNIGVEEVTFIQHNEGFNFIEITGAGAVQTTVIDMRGNSVHSRHTIVQKEIVPSQFYGTCVRNISKR